MLNFTNDQPLLSGILIFNVMCCKLTGAKKVYVLSQLVYSFGSLLMALIRHPVVVILLSPCPGIMYATLFTMPYLLLAYYHSTNTVLMALNSLTC